MGIMNGLARGISTAAYAGADMYAKSSLEEQRAQIQLERDLRLEEFRSASEIRAEDRKNAPLNRISASAKAKMGEEVPLEAAPVTSLSGVNDAGEKFGFNGDLKAVRQAIEKLPEGADKKAAMAQLQGQYNSDTKTGLMNVQGKTRKRTSDEALDAAVQDAKATDLPAYADYEARVGKPLREERKIDVTEASANARAAAGIANSERVALTAERRDATQRYLGELRADTSEKNAQARLEALVKNSGGGSNGTKEALSFIDGARKELANDASSLKALYTAEIDAVGAPSKIPAIKAAYQPKFDAIDVKRKQIESDFNNLREKVGLPPAKSAAQESPAATATAKPTAAAATAKPAGLSAPKTQAEFNAIPSGADYINPADGKTYKKK